MVGFCDAELEEKIRRGKEGQRRKGRRTERDRPGVLASSATIHRRESIPKFS